MKIEIKLNKNLSKSNKATINRSRVKEFGKKNLKDFKRDYEPNTKWFFVKDSGKTVALGGLRPIKIEYLGRKYSVLGICSIISIVKGKGYGTILIEEMIKYIKSKGKTGLGFTAQTEFFKKAGLDTKKKFGNRFALKNPKTGELTFEAENDVGDGIYYEGKDRLISKILLTKSTAYYWIPALKDPHW
ncbi:MAG: GNAT family N-acetyltransferase [archaeon]